MSSQPRRPLFTWGKQAPNKQPVQGAASSERSALLRWAERWALLIERPFNWTGGVALNLFYHTDTLSVFLWLIVAVTGLYLSLFYYQFDFEHAYLTIAVKIEGQATSRIVRAIHRYASDSAMIVTLLHGIRLYFMGRFRGARWLAWVSGVVMVLLLWMDGLSGYWLIWDQRAQLITDSFTVFLSRVSHAAPAFISSLLVASKTDRSWIFITILLTLHILLFAGVALFFWWHIMRLRRPRFWPPYYWMIGAGAVVLVVSALFPVGMLPITNFGQQPKPMALDPFYFFYLPFSVGQNAIWSWIMLIAVFIALNLIPWLALKPAPAPIQIDPAHCTGCTLCSKDCPYKAITMKPRPAGERHKLIAEVDPQLCVACGVCLGSCEPDAITMGVFSETAIWQTMEARIARHQGKPVTLCITCERHAAQGARPYLDGQSSNHSELEVIPLPCVAVIPPSLVARAISRGVGEVRVVGCPPDDCSRREGNLWTDERLSRARLPRLKKEFENAPIYTFWLPPDSFSQALAVLPESKTETHKPGGSYSPVLNWQNFALTFGLLAVLMMVQVWFTNVWSPRLYRLTDARVQLVIPNPIFLGYSNESFARKYAEMPAHLVLYDGGTVLLDRPYPFESKERTEPLVLEFPTSPGDHHLTLSLVGDSKKSDTLMLYDQAVTLSPGQVWIILYDGSSPQQK